MEEGARRRRGSGRRRQSNALLIIIILILLVGAGAGSWAYNKYMPNFKLVDAEEYFGFGQEIGIVLEGERLTVEYAPLLREGHIYLPAQFIKEHVDKYIYWDKEAEKLTVTTAYRLIQLDADETLYHVNMEPLALNFPVYNIDGDGYMPESLITELYNISVEYKEEGRAVVVDYIGQSREIARVISKKAPMRFEPDFKSPIYRELLEGDTLTIYGGDEKYYRVRDNNGIFGYILKKSVSEPEIVEGREKEETPVPLPKKSEIEGKINLAWDLILNVNENSRDFSRAYYKGLDVLSPTWFKFERTDYSGQVLSIADIDYVEAAHEKGYQVWALFSDEEDGEVTARILSDANKRQHVIEQLLAYVSLYKLDGINIDFERVRKEDVAYFHQFLRELWPMLKLQGATLSVDTFVPRAWSMYYDRGEIAKTVDYVCVMTYDENTYGGVSGPNASIPFVEDGVIQTLAEVPPEKLIMGIPYYSRIWIEEETDGVISYNIRNLGMNYAYRLFTENGAEFRWLEDLGCYYGEYEKTVNGKTQLHRTWLEDERSIEEKLKLVLEYDLAGVCAWPLGLEKEEIWELLYSYLKEGQ